MNKSFVLVIVSLCLFISCNLQSNNEYGIQVNNKKIFIITSNLDNLIDNIGDDYFEEYFEYGGEEFYWNNFTVYSYHNDNLSFHVDNVSKKVIRITVNFENETNIKTLFGIKSNTSYEEVEKILVKNNFIPIFKEDKFISSEFYIEDKSKIIKIAVWFTDQNTIKWFDIYYEII